MQHILIIGRAGFINDSYQVKVIDNFDSLYDQSIKRKNLKHIQNHSNFHLLEIDICEMEGITQFMVWIDTTQND